MLSRRSTLAAFAGSIAGSIAGSPGLAAPALPARAAGRAPLIGWLNEGVGSASTDEALRQALARRGHAQITLQTAFAAGDMAKLPVLARELVDRPVDLIWTNGSAATDAARAATTTIPIVMVAADALKGGQVKHLGRPAANVTGLTLVGTELVAKRLELLAQLSPSLQRVVLLAPVPGSSAHPLVAAWLQRARAAAAALRLSVHYDELPQDTALWDAHYATLAAVGGTVLSPLESPHLLRHRDRLAELELRHRLPSVYAFPEHAQAGGLCAYGISVRYINERVAWYTARLLDGAKPAQLPVEQPTRYELVLNLRTARALGIEVPRALRLRADEVIE